jgi:hypothetical protein
MENKNTLLAAIFTASLSSLAYEILLMRIFAFSLWYHFAFMVISIAMLGIGASGTFLSVYTRFKKTKYLPIYFVLFSTCIPLSYVLINAVPLDPVAVYWDKVQLVYVSLYYIFLALPFFFFGLIISTAFSTYGGYARYIYGADLTGAGAGALLIILMLNTFRPEYIVFIVALISIAPLFFVPGHKKIKSLSLLLFIACLSLLISHPSFIRPRISPYKPLEVALKFPDSEILQTFHSPYSRVDVFKSPAVRFAPGLSFKYLESLPEQIGLAVDAGNIYAITNHKSKKDLEFINYLPSVLPYGLSAKDSVLIIEPKGGLPVLIADYYGFRNILKIESDPLVIKAVREYTENFATDIYKNNTWSGLGRSWINSLNKNFDLIDVSIMDSMPSGSFGFSEDYSVTVEAFEEYIEYLNPNGFLSMNLFFLPPPRTELRLINTLTAAYAKHGIADIRKHIAAIRSWGTITIIAKKSELTGKDIHIIKGFAGDKRFDLIYYPGISEKETNVFIKMPSNDYFIAFKSLIDPGTRQEFNDTYLFDIKPVYDENPFFHYYLRMKNISEIYSLMGDKWQYFIEEGYLLPVIFIQVLLISLVFILLPAVTTGLKRRKHLIVSPKLPLAYFGFLGIGFMFIEISFIQKMILPLVNPSYAASTVLCSILVSSGLGSIMSERLKILQSPKVLLALSVIVLLYVLFLPAIIQSTSAFTLAFKILFIFFILMPAGILMGIPFPLGITMLNNNDPDLIPWAWAVNGCLSVTAPIVAIMLAISIGFKMVMVIGSAMYLSAFLYLLLVKSRLNYKLNE